MRMLDEMIDRQKLIKIMDLSERMYLARERKSAQLENSTERSIILYYVNWWNSSRKRNNKIQPLQEKNTWKTVFKK